MYYSTSNGEKTLLFSRGVSDRHGHIQGAHRHDVLLFPERLDDYMAEDNPIRFIAAFVDELDLASSGFQRAGPAMPGRFGYAPGDLCKLYLCGSLCRLGARRRLAQETPRKVALLGLVQKLRPDHKTIADFRKHTLQSCTMKTRNRAAQALRMAAQLVLRADCALGAFSRRLKGRRGTAQAPVATAQKMARTV